jgi:hypothetical protein
MSNQKLILVYNDEGVLKKESVWVTKFGDNYKVDNIPFFAPNIALGDLVEAEEDEDELYFFELIKPSGHSTIQLVFFQKEADASVLQELERMGCSWEGSHLKNYIAVDVPSKMEYEIAKQFLTEQRTKGLLDFKEACLGFL